MTDRTRIQRSESSRILKSSGPLARLARCLVWLAALVPGATQVLAAEPLPLIDSVSLSAGTPAVGYDVDFGTLPARPVLVVEVFPDANHLDMTLEIEVTNYQIPWGVPGGICPSPETSNRSTSRRLEREMYTCQPAGGYPGTTATVVLRAIHFGAGAGPATVYVRMRGVTRPPTATLAAQVSGPRQISIPASKDTTLYQDAPSASNGAGQWLWAGMETQDSTFGPLRNSLVAFDVAAEIPSSATVNDATLSLHVTAADPSWIAQRLDVFRVAPAANGFGWLEGTADQPGDEFYGLSGIPGVADWNHRASPFPFFNTLLWSVPGGDPVGSPLHQFWFIDSPRPLLGSSAELTSAVQDMVSTGNSRDGFVLTAPGATFPFFRRGLQLASRDNPNLAQHPSLIVNYSPVGAAASGEIQTNVLNFIDEGQNFRWIYDLDQDDVYVSPVGGICTVVARPPSQSSPLPYSYAWGGAAGYQGVDCCTWRIDSGDTGTVGTGQALFFHNLDPDDPTNDPQDADQDGIVDFCDNCPYSANGPLLGSCASGPTIGAPCYSNSGCGTGGTCDLWQQDQDGNHVGNACPEPGFAVGLLAGLAALAARARAHRRSA